VRAASARSHIGYYRDKEQAGSTMTTGYSSFWMIEFGILNYCMIEAIICRVLRSEASYANRLFQGVMDSGDSLAVEMTFWIGYCSIQRDSA
jgi:hypothetical protein